MCEENEFFLDIENSIRHAAYSAYFLHCCLYSYDNNNEESPKLYRAVFHISPNKGNNSGEPAFFLLKLIFFCILISDFYGLALFSKVSKITHWIKVTIFLGENWKEHYNCVCFYWGCSKSKINNDQQSITVDGLLHLKLLFLQFSLLFPNSVWSPPIEKVFNNIYMSR